MDGTSRRWREIAEDFNAALRLTTPSGAGELEWAAVLTDSGGHSTFDVISLGCASAANRAQMLHCAKQAGEQVLIDRLTDASDDTMSETDPIHRWWRYVGADCGIFIADRSVNIESGDGENHITRFTLPHVLVNSIYVCNSIAYRLERNGDDFPELAPVDRSGFVAVSKIWMSHFDTYRAFKNWLNKTPDSIVRRRKPSPMRLEIYIPDWLHFWSRCDHQSSESFDSFAASDRRN